MEKNLSLIVLDREKIEKNLYYQELTKRIKEYLAVAREMLESEISAPLDKLRYYQGQAYAWNLFFQLPDLILNDLSIEEETQETG